MKYVKYPSCDCGEDIHAGLTHKEYLWIMEMTEMNESEGVVGVGEDKQGRNNNNLISQNDFIQDAETAREMDGYESDSCRVVFSPELLGHTPTPVTSGLTDEDIRMLSDVRERVSRITERVSQNADMITDKSRL